MKFKMIVLVYEFVDLIKLLMMRLNHICFSRLCRTPFTAVFQYRVLSPVPRAAVLGESTVSEYITYTIYPSV